MKKENGMGVITAIFILIIIIVLISLGSYFFINLSKDEKIEDIKANMLLIQGKCKILSGTGKVNNSQDNLKGKKISEMKEDNIISGFLAKGLIQEDKEEKYYVLSDDDLSQMGLDIKNEEDSYYIVNYEENIVFVTKGYIEKDSEDVKYRLEE